MEIIPTPMSLPRPERGHQLDSMMMTPSRFRSTFLFLSLLCLLVTPVTAQQYAPPACASAVVHPYDPIRHEVHYTVGVLANRGDDTAYAEFNSTFADYLSATAGRRFNPPIRFQMRPLSFGHIFEEHQHVDFIYVNPSAFSCIESEYGAEALVSLISRRTVAGNTYDLTRFGGVIATLANNTAVNTLEDLKGKIIAAVSISGLGSGQMQFRELQKAGLSYINDPKQLVFTSNQGKIVQGLLAGDFDVGFIRTDQLERSNGDEDLETFLKRFKIINQQPSHVLENGVPFPFQTSTPLYPEWGVAALLHVDEDVSRAVQESLMALSDHAEACVDENCTAIQRSRCDTTPQIARLAHTSMTLGKYAGWRSSLSYIDLRSMQEGTGFIRLDEDTHKWQCVRSVELYEAVTCPDGYFRKTKEQVEQGCHVAGLECQEDFQCICQPCLKGHDVDVYPLDPDLVTTPTTNQGVSRGCAKMSLCGSTKQTKKLTFRAADNLKREVLNMTVILHEGEQSREVPVNYDPEGVGSDYIYEFTVSAQLVGVMTMEIFANGEQIPESPLRMLVEDRACEAEFGGEYEATGEGACVCKGSYVDIGDKCVPYAVLLPSIFLPMCALVALASYLYVERKRREADALWSVSLEDLKFADPKIVLGLGTFGEVHLATFHGTSVAVKRVLPPRRADLLKSAEHSIKLGRPAQPEDVELGEPEQQRRASDDSETSTTDESLVNHIKPKATFGLVSGYRVGTASNAFLRGIRSQKRSSGFHRSSARSSLEGIGASSAAHSKLKADFIKEMRLLSKLRHPCITTVMGAVVDPSSEPMLVLEYCEHGSLNDLLNNETIHIEGELLLPLLRDIAQGIRFLHSSKPPVVHGDLKSHNVLVTQGFRAKIADFGLSQKAKNAKAMGTPYWMSPELLRGQAQNSPSSDMYAFGIILYEIYSRSEPYSGEDSYEVLAQVCDRRVNKRPPIPEGCPKEISSLMKACWNGDPRRRPTAEALDERLKLFHVENVQPGYSRSLKKQNQQGTISNQDFLYEVFPKHIADSLLRGEKVEPESHEITTILFADVVGFTSIASTCSPLKVSDMLDRLYMALDRLLLHHDLWKVETIGDGYMAVSNLIKDQSDDHVKRVAEFAMDAVQEASKIPVDVDDPSKGFVQIRIGFHSGPVVSNVVGSLNPRYGLFGDTVNVASRMESTSQPGRIHCSKVSAQLLMSEAPDIELRRRGEVDVKGKGKMSTYFIVGGEKEDWGYSTTTTTKIKETFVD